MPDFAVTNARLVLPHSVERGCFAVEDGRLHGIGGAAPTSAEDWGGDYALPGLIELHTDHIETHFKPRPGVVWDAEASAMSHDAQIAASGITTVFDAYCVGMDADRLDAKELTTLIDAVWTAQNAGTLRAEHFTHLRCEVSEPSVVEAFEAARGHPSVQLVSLMDHTPGQRQFARLEAHRKYFQGKGGLDAAEYDALLEDRMARAETWSDRNRRALADAAGAAGLTLASHDDATEAHVAEAVRDGVRVAEFPTTIEAAEASRTAGLAVLMGAPNVVRGGSHSGNVSALDLADRGALDILSSDYVPGSLLFALPLLARREGWDMARAVATVTRAPADALGLTDRGALLDGRRADLVRLSLLDGRPVVRAVYREGLRVC